MLSSPIWCACLLLLVIGFSGCQPTNQSTSTKQNQSTPDANDQHFPQSTSSNSDRLDGIQILQKTVARYSAANSYRDRAVLYLNYRLEGRPIQEPHPFATVWESRNRLSSRIFNSQIQCDGRLLSCFVFDNDSANLDNQQVLLPVADRIPISDLYQDSIVRHFVGGYAELPLDESEKTAPPKLIPPPVSLLTRQVPFGWLQTSEQADREDDQTVDGRRCYVVRSLYRESTADLWIDQQTWLLVQISLPLRLMARPVLTSGEIENVELLVRFHDAAIDGPVDSQEFAVHPRVDGNVVRKFVPVPESFPSELIGQISPKFELLQIDGTAVDALHFDGKPTALLWMGGESSFAAVELFSNFCRDFPVDQFNFGAVYSELELAEPESSSLEPAARLKTISTATGLPLYFDRQLETSSKLKIKTIPSIIVLNGDSKIGFARAISDDQWPRDLAAAIKRIQNNENVAGEMQREYQKFLQAYHQQLSAVSARHLIAANSSDATTSTVPSPISNIADVQLQHSNFELKPAWTNAEFQRAGNIQVDDRLQPAKLFVLDGWRTVVELSPGGKTLARHELKLPDQTAVSCLRIAKSIQESVVSAGKTNAGSPTAQFAVFNVQGEQVFLFDADWEPVATLPDDRFQHDGIRDVQFIESDPDTNQKIAVAFAGDRGTYLFDLGDRTTKQISNLATESLAATRSDLLLAQTDSIRWLSAGQMSVPNGLRFQRLLTFESNRTPQILATAVDNENNWFLASIEKEEAIDWRQPIGSQLFENEIEPLAFGRTHAGIVVAVADATRRVSLISGTGTYLGQLPLSENVAGIGLVVENEASHLIVSTADRVQGYRLHSMATKP